MEKQSVIKRRATIIYPLQAYYQNQASSSVIPTTCKMLYKCDERSGFLVNSVTGHKYDPHNLVVTGGVDDGFLEFTEDNAVNINMNTSGIGVITEINQTFSTRKIILLAAHLLPVEDISDPGLANTRVGMGIYGNVHSGDSAVLSLSFAGNMHGQFDITGNGTDFIHTIPDLNRTVMKN